MMSFLRFVIKPYGIIAVTSLISFLMWEFPSFDGSVRKGFNSPFDTSYIGVLICISWLAITFGLAYCGFNIGSKIKMNTEKIDRRVSINSFRPYLMISIIGYIGLAYVLLQITASLGLKGIISAIVGGQANTLKDTLYSNYSVGVASLRYLAIPAAALGMYNIINRRYIALNILNIASLGLVAIISSRLSIIFTIFTFLPLLLSKVRLRITPIQVIIFLLVIFHILAALNYSRNILFYRSIGIDNFYLAGFSEIVTYIGSPFQGFLATGTLGNRLYMTSDIDSSLLTGISFELSTNSTFLELTRNNGVLEAFLTISFYTLFGSLIMGIAVKNSKNLISILFGSVGYCFAEIWRVFLFGQGIIYTIIIMVILVTLWCVYIPGIGSNSYRLKDSAL